VGGGALALDGAWLLAAFLVVLVLAAAGIAGRRFLLERGGGTVECGLRRPNGSWRLGVARYRGEELRWYGIFGLSVRPDEVFPRRDLAVISRRRPTAAEAATLGPGMIVVECRLSADTSQLPAAPVSGSGSGGGSGGGGPGPGNSQAAASGPGADSGPGAPSGSGPAFPEDAGPADDGGGTAPPEPVIVELALGEAALTGLLSWLEAGPPGSHLGPAI
jgi:hypothetical protein